MTLETLDDLFFHTVKDVLCAQRKILKLLPKMEHSAMGPQLKATLAQRREEALSKLTGQRLNVAVA